MINKEYRDDKAVKNAINKIHTGEYQIVRSSEVDTDALTNVEE